MFVSDQWNPGVQTHSRSASAEGAQADGKPSAGDWCHCVFLFVLVYTENMFCTFSPESLIMCECVF